MDSRDCGWLVYADDVVGNRESLATLPSIAVSMLYSRLVASDPNENGWSKFMLMVGSEDNRPLARSLSIMFLTKACGSSGFPCFRVSSSSSESKYFARFRFPSTQLGIPFLTHLWQGRVSLHVRCAFWQFKHARLAFFFLGLDSSLE